jgi:serine/threonine protein kinase
MHELVSKSTFSESTAMAYFDDMISAVSHVHSSKIAHLDIKLENWLIVDGVVKLSDFGLSCLQDHDHLLQGRIGTRRYCAPEMLEGFPYDGFLSDTWSLGVCLFAMLSGFFPYECARKDDWRFVKFFDKTPCIVTSLHAAYGLPCVISPGTRVLVHRMLQPAHRRPLPCKLQQKSDSRRVCGSEMTEVLLPVPVQC